LIKGVNEGDGSARRYNERRARVSTMNQLNSGDLANCIGPPSWSASSTSWYVYPRANWFAIGGLFARSRGRRLLAPSVETQSRNSLCISGVPPVAKSQLELRLISLQATYRAPGWISLEGACRSRCCPTWASISLRVPDLCSKDDRHP
jgi:hypothetical protein